MVSQWDFNVFARVSQSDWETPSAATQSAYEFAAYNRNSDDAKA
jgi:hypothetical protein